MKTILNNFNFIKSIKPNTVFWDNIKISLNAIRSNLLRAILTIAIIAFGIMALVGILTAIDAIKGSINSEFSLMGANSFAIVSRGITVYMGNKQYRTKNYSHISYRQAKEFKDNFKFPAKVAISTYATGIGTVKYKSKKSNPNVDVWGVDENDLFTSGKEIGKGRNFTQSEIEQFRNLVIVGNDIVRALFDKNENPLGKEITVGGGRYKIIGVLKEKGSSMAAQDRICLIPVTNVRQYFSRPNRTFRINIRPLDPNLMEAAEGEATGLFRIIRNLDVKDETDFNIERSDRIAQILIENIKYVAIAATIIGVITLFGAAIGLMNIMLVSVTERTREIGIRKAIGAKSKTIKRQFLFESVVIGQLGGLIGIFLGILIGNIMSVILKSPFIIPWHWIIGGVVLCFVVGVISGYVPAVKASKLDPIIALHYE